MPRSLSDDPALDQLEQDLKAREGADESTLADESPDSPPVAQPPAPADQPVAPPPPPEVPVGAPLTDVLVESRAQELRSLIEAKAQEIREQRQREAEAAAKRLQEEREAKRQEAIDQVQQALDDFIQRQGEALADELDRLESSDATPPPPPPAETVLPATPAADAGETGSPAGDLSVLPDESMEIAEDVPAQTPSGMVTKRLEVATKGWSSKYDLAALVLSVALGLLLYVVLKEISFALLPSDIPESNRIMVKIALAILAVVAGRWFYYRRAKQG